MIVASNVVTSCDQSSGFGSGELRRLRLDVQQERVLKSYAHEMAKLGGPQAVGVALIAARCATLLLSTMSRESTAEILEFAEGRISALVLEMPFQDAVPMPDALPRLDTLASSFEVLYLSSRTQVLMQLVRHRVFAYDIDNEGQVVRVVANFKGGGANPKVGENAQDTVELSSHSGLALGPHTESPYWCCRDSRDGHSPAPSMLALTALWNPALEPTTIIPIPDVLKVIGPEASIALTQPHFTFTRSDSFAQGKGSDGKDVSVLDFDSRAGFSIRFNSYRFDVDTSAPSVVKDAYSSFLRALSSAASLRPVVTSASTLLINNLRAVHCREVIQDDRRALIRLFGYNQDARPIVISNDPLIVQG